MLKSHCDYLDIAEKLFENYPSVQNVINFLRSPSSCKNSPKWEFVVDTALPGHACGVPTLPTVEYLLDVSRQVVAVECSDPEECDTEDCDPYLSVLTSKWFCFSNIRAPNLHDWDSDKAFVSHFIQVSKSH